MKTTSDLPNLPNGFPDQQSLCEYALPALTASHVGGINDWVFLSPADLKKVLFSNSGWQLTKTGAEMMATTFKPYITINPDNLLVTGKILLGMDRCCQGPWHLRGKTAMVFDPHLHLEIQIVGGRISDFIDFKLPPR